MMHFGGHLSSSKNSPGNLVPQKFLELGHSVVPALFEIRYDALTMNVPAEVVYQADIRVLPIQSQPTEPHTTR